MTNMLFKNSIKIIKRFSKILFYLCGSISVFVFIICFTTIPFKLHYQLAIANSSFTKIPDYIIILGGGAIPSPSGLMRTYCGAEVAKIYPESKIIVSLPADSNNIYSSHTYKMKKELMIRGIDSTRILLEIKGRNTRWEALEIRKMISDTNMVLLVSNPEHIYRSILTFKKVGFSKIGGYPAFDAYTPEDLKYNSNELGGRNMLIPNIGNNINLRYVYWAKLGSLGIVTREYFALVYYKMKGWI